MIASPGAPLTPEPDCPKAVYRILRKLPERDNPKLTKTLKGLREVIIEGKERDIDRPLDREEQRRNYRGKKAISSKIM